MKTRYKIIAGLSLFALLLTGCNNSDGNNSGGSSGGDNPPITENSYTITWKNYDGTVLEIDEKVPAGATPSYDGTTPLRENTQNYNYTFSGWSPEIKAVTSDATYTAQYDGVLTAAYVTFDLNGGRTSSNSQSRYMSSIDAENFFFDVTKDDYNFRGWEYNGSKIFDGKGNKINNADIAETMTFKALFAQTAYLTITSNLKDAGVITGEGEYNYNTNVTLNVAINEGYKFIGWYYEDGTLLSNQASYPFMMWNEDVTIIAKFDYESYKLHVQSYNNTLGLVLIKGMTQTYVEEQEMQVKYQSKATIAAYTSTEIGFLGWFDDDGNLIETNAVYEFVMPHHDYKLVARWNSFRLQLSSSDTTLGTVNDVSDNYSYNDKINLVATPNEGAEFVGWYLNNETLLSTNASYQFMMPYQNASITARFKLKSFNINVYTTDSSKGTVSGSGKYEYGSEVTLTATPLGDNSFKGWYLDNELLSNNNPYTFTIGNADLSIEGRFAGILYTISFETNGGDPIADLVAEQGDPISVNPTRAGYTFVGWYTDPSCTLTSYFELGDTMPAYNGALYAKWSLINYTITFVTNGGDSISPISAAYGDSIVIPTPTKGSSIFGGWFTDSSLTNKANITTMPGENITLYAKWTDMYTVFEMDSKQYIYFGSYPQSVVSDSSLKTELSKISSTNSRGYYEYGGNEYAKKNVNANSSSYKYANGAQVNNYTTEYFKVEPILWRVLASDSSGNYTLLAEQAINAHRYNEYWSGTDSNGRYANNYQYSEIRTWLNDDFYNSAFKSMEKDAILTTNVDNSAATTDSTSNPYVCDNTSDKVYLLSYKDYQNTSYGFSNNQSRYCKPTDYAIANGSYMYEGGSYDRNCYYWTRSPRSDYSYYAWLVDDFGYLNYNYYVYDTYYSVRPSLSINIA